MFLKILHRYQDMRQTISPVNLRWKWPNLEQIATEGFFALTG